jgi:hypothetical protein
VPFDIDGMEAKPDWRDHFVWPVAPLDLEAMHQRVLTAYFGLVRETLGDDQRTAILAMWPIVGFAMSEFEIAAYADTRAALTLSRKLRPHVSRFGGMLRSQAGGRRGRN